MKTQRGVYHDLTKTEYATTNGVVAFFFSSTFYRDKFLSEYKEHRLLYTKRIEKAMMIGSMNVSLLSDLFLYKTIEKRGFRVAKIHDNTIVGDLKWHESHALGLHQVTEKNMLDWREMYVQK